MSAFFSSGLVKLKIYVAVLKVEFMMAVVPLVPSFNSTSTLGTYLHHKKIKVAQGIKITAQFVTSVKFDLEVQLASHNLSVHCMGVLAFSSTDGFKHAIAGTSLYVVGPDDDVEDIKEAAMEDMKSVMSRIDKSGEGVYVQATTLGSIEALLEFLKTPGVSITVSGIGIGPVHKNDVIKASVMLEKKKEYATILAFDVKVTQGARELSDELGVKFKACIDTIKEEKKKEVAEEAVFPCVLKIVRNCVFNKKDPIVLGVDVLEGIFRVSCYQEDAMDTNIDVLAPIQDAMKGSGS
ncbi:hypothetical protein KY290_017190 [Solanum tuberosum]|uniref:Translation initiation factor IF- 2 domain-containing protein n=1 Tax=Solanum tuberosum TaxID=4113 RepID=A0ABQ7VAM6_SOLTU|nr:hypothetical protein KY284_019047 [Solanum tuberosum]KAH0761117.1 hypothetical protein KY290_017190 [Solanum tuberosum]